MVKRKHAGGFSLLEVLVAFTITALLLGVISQIYAKGTAAALLGEEYSQAVAIAQSKMAMLGRTASLDTSEYHGLEHGKFHWILTIEDYNKEPGSQIDSSIYLKAISLEVSWESNGKHRVIQFHSLRPAIEI